MRHAVCAWCGEAHPGHAMSHGICDDCFESLYESPEDRREGVEAAQRYLRARGEESRDVGLVGGLLGGSGALVVVWILADLCCGIAERLF